MVTVVCTEKYILSFSSPPVVGLGREGVQHGEALTHEEALDRLLGHGHSPQAHGRGLHADVETVESELQ